MSSQPALFDDLVAVDADDVVGADRVRARVCHPSGTPRRRTELPDMDAVQLRDAVRSLTYDDLVAVIMALCTGMYPRIARDSVIAELARRPA